jgi:hypothetical protein
MTGAELVAFITANSLENEELSIEFFSWEKKLKYCGGCPSILPLEQFHRISTFEPQNSSGYKHLCKVCFRKKYSWKKNKINWDAA